MFYSQRNKKRQLKGDKLHINWIPFGDINMGSSRTNVWDVHDELKKINSVISTVNGDDWDSYDVVIFQKVYDKKLFRHVKKRCLLGFSIGDTHMIFEKGIRAADFVLCSCEALKKELLPLNKNCHVVIEGERMSRYKEQKIMKDRDEVVLLYHGFKENILHLLKSVAPAINQLSVNKKVSVKIISNFQDMVSIPFFEVPVTMCRWSLEGFNLEAIEGDIGIIPQGEESQFRLKSANKIRTLMAMGIPVIGDKRNQDFQMTLGNNEYGLLAHTQQEWTESLELLINNYEKRCLYAQKGFQRVSENYTTTIAALQVIEAVRGYFT